jgi:hypothetical protein
MLPRPDFAKLRALRKHITQALKQLVCPQSQIHRWTGLVMDPGLYALIKPGAFTVPVNPGATPVYQPFAPPAMMKMVDYAFKRNKNYFLSYSNINRACFHMLDDSIPIQFKVSNIPNLTGWNASMSIQEILTQLEMSYGKPTPMVLHNIDLLFQSPMSTTDAPEMLFYRIKQCQEIAMLAGDPYTQMQIMNTVVRILMQAQVLPSKKYNTWEQTPAKAYPGLKTFIHETYTRCLQSLALRKSTGQQGCSQGGTNMFNLLADKDKDEDTDTANDATTVTQTAAYTMGSTIGNTYGGATLILSEISTAINQLAANHVAIQQQMAAVTFAATSPSPHTQFQIPQIQNMAQQPFAGVAQGIYNTNQGGGGCQQGGHGRGCTRSRGGGRGRGAFAQQIQGGFGGIPPFVNGPPVAFVPPTGAWVNASFQSNLTKRYANWNLCWSCGFDVEDGHTLATCPTHWRKTNHQVGFTRRNVQQWINQRYAPCTKEMHKTKLPKQPGQF